MNNQNQAPVINPDDSVNESKPIGPRKGGRKPSAATLAFRERLERDVRKKCVEKNSFYIKWLIEDFKEADPRMIESMVRRERRMLLGQLGDVEKEVLKKEVIEPFDPSKAEPLIYKTTLQKKVAPDPTGDNQMIRKRMEEDERNGELKDAVFYTDLIANRYPNQERTRESIGMSVRRELKRIKDS